MQAKSAYSSHVSTFTATQLFQFANLERICLFVAQPHKDKIITMFAFCYNKKPCKSASTAGNQTCAARLQKPIVLN